MAVQHDPLTEEPIIYDLKDPEFPPPSNAMIWEFKAEDVYDKLQAAIAVVRSMQLTVKDMKTPISDKAPSATDDLLKVLLEADKKASVVINLPSPDDSRKPGDPPGGWSSTRGDKKE